jgi:FkbM family methyltransferase
MNGQINFYRQKSFTKRNDDEFFWSWFNAVQSKGYFDKLKTVLKNKIKNLIKYTPGQEWFNSKSELLFNTRLILEDEYSRLQFDLYILLKVLGPNRYFFPRSYFEEFISILSQEEFNYDLPKDNSGFPLKKYIIRINDKSKANPELNIITYDAAIILTNKWRQYFIKRDNLNMIPSIGDIVFDCGSCIGDTGLLFAACVGSSGAVHLFDPVPLHNRYCQLQADINPLLKNSIHINQQALGDIEEQNSGVIEDVTKITAGGCTINNFNVTTIDNYCIKHNIQKANYIKMDIEGAEISALLGASTIIGNSKPKLAISAYHKQEDLWEIPLLMKKLNPEYKIYFEQHLPIYWEACFYAI